MSFTIIHKSNCHICRKSFGQNNDLKRHVKTVHQKLRDYKCEDCFKPYGLKKHLIRHLKTVH